MILSAVDDGSESLDDVYVKLRKHLDTFVLSAPEAESILGILRIRFTPEEAGAALILSQQHVEITKLAQRGNLDVNVLRPVLERMADKALVYKKNITQDGVAKELYCLLPTAVGLWETSFATGERNPRTEQLARLWQEYYKSGWGKSMLGGAPFTRVIPVGKSIDTSQEIFPYEKAAELIKRYDFAVVIHCPCRKSAELSGSSCGKVTEVCFHFGDLARFMSERGYGREVDQTEVLEILDQTEKAGLVHVVGNAKEMGVSMCSCCPCCCTQLQAIAHKPHAMAKSRFIAGVEQARCIACGLCAKRCPVRGVTSIMGPLHISEEKCIGCGLCVTTCPTQAISLKERQTYQEPFDTGRQLFAAWSQKDKA